MAVTVEASKVRNIGILGHGGTGKTMLIEHLLHSTGRTNRLGSVEEGTTVGDYLDEEIQHHHTITMKLMHLDWKGTRVHIVDHPGYADFLGEVAASAPVLDGMIVMIDAGTGPRVGTDNAIRYADKYGIARAFFVNKLDHENTNFDEIVESIQQTYGSHCVPLVIPVGSGAGFEGVVNIVTGENPDMADRMEEIRSTLMDAVAESDDELVEKYLEEGELSAEEFSRGLRQGICSGTIVPILAGSVEKTIGLDELMDLVTDYFPSPLERKVIATNGRDEEIEIDPAADQPFLAQVFRSVIDPFVGQLTLFRVLSGTLKSDSEFYNVTTENKERTGKIFMLCGKEQTQVPSVGPGDLAAMTKLKHTHFGDTIAAPGSSVRLRKIELPESMVKLAITAKTRKDDDKIGDALNRIAEEDPTFAHYRDPETQEHVVKGMGDLQLEILLERMKNKFHVEAETSTPKVAYKESIKGTAEVQGKHKKQSGGHGQYGDVRLKLSPNERGGGYKFVDKIVGGVVPRQYIPHVGRGAQEALKKGVIAGYPVVDVIVELTFGSYHDVDSSEMAFKIAASMAVNKGIKEAKPCLLEPVMEIEITVPKEYMGDINGDLSSRRGRILGMEEVGLNMECIRAHVPEAEILRYSTDLRSLTGGRGVYTAKFSRYDEVPDHVAQQLIAEYQKAREAGE